MGIDVQKPCLSWNCQDGIHQTAYEIEAKTGEDVIYNSGKVASDSMNVMLDADLASKQQVVWHVRLWAIFHSTLLKVLALNVRDWEL